MITFFVSLGILILGYFTYGRLTEKVFGPDDRKTPAVEINDGVDHTPIKTWKAILIQLLNIAGTGPIFGALMGACFGPVVFLWIVFGSILGGAVHDYMTGMISERNDGASIAQLAGIFLGKPALYIMRIFSVVLLVLTGTVFVTSPAGLIASLTPESLGEVFWIVVILLYYVAATLLPIDKIIGRFYPIFGVILIVMAVSIAGGMIFSTNYSLPELTFTNMHPKGLPIWPYMFITVACGAISGFHATQSPMMAKCITSEKEGRKVFYGAMLIESVIALIWAAAGVAFYGSTQALSDGLDVLGQSGVVYHISHEMLGRVGGILAIVGVVICPITSGDTAFRSARLILAEWTKLDQKKIKNRLLITIPLLVVATILTQLDFDILWRYFSWSNQTLAMISLWVCSAYLMMKSKHKIYSLITAIPAAFMTAVSITYILMAKEGFQLSSSIAYPVGIAVAVLIFALYCVNMGKHKTVGQVSQ